MGAKVTPKFLKYTLTDANWTDYDTIGLPARVFALEIRNTTAACQVRKSAETAEIDDYAVDEIYRLEPVRGKYYDMTGWQIKGANNDILLGEYHV